MNNCLFNPGIFFPWIPTEYPPNTPFAPAVPQALKVFSDASRDFRKNQVKKIHFSWQILRQFFQCTFKVYRSHSFSPKDLAKPIFFLKPLRIPTFFFVPLDTKLWIHHTPLVWEFSRSEMTIWTFSFSRKKPHLMVQNDSYQPGTWISKNMFSTFFDKKSFIEKRQQQFVTWWWKTSFQKFFGQHEFIILQFSGPTSILTPPANSISPSEDLQISHFRFPWKSWESKLPLKTPKK